MMTTPPKKHEGTSDIPSTSPRDEICYSVVFHLAKLIKGWKNIKKWCIINATILPKKCLLAIANFEVDFVSEYW